MKALILTISGLLLIAAAFLWFQQADDTPAQQQTDAGVVEKSQGSSRKSGTGAGTDAGTGGSKQPGRQAAPAGTTAGTAAPASAPGPATLGGRSRGGRQAALVVTEAISESVINNRLKAVGNGRAAASVNVVPLSSGLLTQVLVQSGQSVKAGDILAQLDDEEQLIARDRAARTAEDAAIDEARLSKLFKSRTTTQVELNKARAQHADAQLALRESELTLSRRSVRAPISGIVGIITVDKGNYVTSQDVLITIDDRSTIVVEFWVPERYANQVAVGQSLKAKSQANPGNPIIGHISAIDSRIESDSRTLPVEARFENSADSLRPGMSFDVQIDFNGQSYPSISPLAVQWNANGAYIWRIVDKKAERVPVLVVQRNPNSILVQGDLIVGEQIVVEGLLSLRPGSAVRLQGAKP